jgi:putative tricarboxylic transport membrane protein
LRINREAVVAAALLLLSGVFYAATFTIRRTSYATIGSDLWPRIVILVLAAFTVVHLITSLRQRAPEGGETRPSTGGLAGFYTTYRNPIWCFVIFALFLLTLPYLGMLIGGVLFVFVMLTALGDRDVRSLALHAAIALGTVGAMWAVFTFALHVILPQGMIIRFQ